jgi:hypothetical protein
MYRAVAAFGALVLLAVTFSDSRALFAPAPVYMTSAQAAVAAPQMVYNGEYVEYMQPEMQAQMQPQYAQPQYVEYVEVVEESASSWSDIAMLAVVGAAVGGAIGYQTKKATRAGDVQMQIGFGGAPPAPPVSGWNINEISSDGKLVQRIEGHTRKTWKFGDTTQDRVQVALTSEGRPVHSDVHLWLGPNYTPFSIKAYSEDGKLRPVQALVGTKNKEVTVEVKNVGESDFPIKAAANYAKGAMAALAIEMPATAQGERVDGQALRSYPLNPGAKQLEVILNTEGRQLKARVELLNAPNNPKQTFEVYASDGQLTSLCVCFDTPDEGNTVRILNLSPVEFPMNIHLNEK